MDGGLSLAWIALFREASQLRMLWKRKEILVLNNAEISAMFL
jgi:hypothetical protein